MYKQYSIDLHNMGYNEAIENVRMKVNELVNIQQKYMEKSRKSISINLKIITGRGMHSEGNPVIKLGVIRLLKVHGIPFTIQERTKGGAISVRIKSSQHMI